MNFDTSPELPFVKRGGNTMEIATYNRISAINRMNWLINKELHDFDIRLKSDTWRKCWELEMFKRFYINDTRHELDEEFCQNGTKVAVEMEKADTITLDEREHAETFKTAVESEARWHLPKGTTKNNKWEKRIKMVPNIFFKTKV